MIYIKTIRNITQILIQVVGSLHTIQEDFYVFLVNVMFSIIGFLLENNNITVVQNGLSLLIVSDCKTYTAACYIEHLISSQCLFRLYIIVCAPLILGPLPISFLIFLREIFEKAKSLNFRFLNRSLYEVH